MTLLPIFLKQFKCSDVQLLILDPDGDVHGLEHVALTIQIFLGLQVLMEFLNLYVWNYKKSIGNVEEKMLFKCALFDLCNMLFVMCVSSDTFTQIKLS